MFVRPAVYVAAVLCAAGASRAALAPAAPLQLFERQEPEPRLGAIEFEGADAASLRGQLEGLEEGAPLDLRAVREALRQLYTSRRFSRVTAFVEPMEPPAATKAPPGVAFVRLHFQLTPVLEIVSVSFPGHSAISESVLKSTANLTGAFQPAQTPRAVKSLLDLYRRAGYRRAAIAVHEHAQPGGVALELQVDEGEPTRIDELLFPGVPSLSRAELLAALRLQPGDVLNQAQLEEGVRGLRESYRRAGRLRAKVEAAQIVELPGDRVRVLVPVNAGPKVTFHIRGNRAFTDHVLLSQIQTDSDEPFDQQAVQEMAANFRRFYVGQGFLRARVSTREISPSPGEVQIFFSVSEDQPVRVEQLLFAGNQAIPTGELQSLVEDVLADGTSIDPALGADPSDVERTGVAGRPDPPSPRRYHVEPSTVFDPVLYARAIRQIEDLYKSQGYLNVQVGAPKLAELAGRYRVSATIPIREGEQARVASLKIEGGGGEVKRSELEAALVLANGGVFSYLAAEEGRGRITLLYTSRGHLYAKVEDEEIFAEPDPKDPRHAVRVHVTYRIQPGPLVKVSFVRVEGPEQLRTVEGLILDLVNIKPGDILRPETMDRAQQALLRTGLFFSATLTPSNPQVEEAEKVLQVSLRERPTQSFLGSIGFSNNDGPRATLQFQQANLGGKNLTFSAVVKADFPFLRYDCSNSLVIINGQTCNGFLLPPDPIERVVDLGLNTPRLYPLTDAVRGAIDLIHERATRPSYNLTKFSAQVTAESVQRRPFSLGLALEVGYQTFEERVDILQLVDPSERRQFLQSTGSMVFSSLRPTLTLDLRDEPGRTRKGFFAQAIGDYMRSLTHESFHTNLIRLSLLAAGYIPLPLNSSLLLSARGGYNFQLDAESRTPGDRRFYLGGATTLRGFPEDGMQPEDNRIQLHQQIDKCKATLTGASCSTNVILALQGTSSGGDAFAAVRAEARIALGGPWELALFYDAGNLLSNPGAPTTKLSDLLKIHDATGAGVRYATPIGRMALDIGFNLRPDSDLGERTVGGYFSIDTL